MKFRVGDVVITKDDKVGYIKHICYCDRCRERGFFEPTIQFIDGSDDYINCYEAQNIKQNYKRIGKYDFCKNKREWSKWCRDSNKYIINPFGNVRMILNNYSISYRNNGKKVQVKCGGYKAEASCNNEDTFNLNTGYELARRRLIAKMIAGQVDAYAKTL